MGVVYLCEVTACILRDPRAVGLQRNSFLFPFLIQFILSAHFRDKFTVAYSLMLN